MGVEAVITTFSVGDVQVPGGKGTRPITPDDMADLVEYSFGDADTTWGKKRIEEDKHPAIYNWSYIELGNVRRAI
jgi:alpha-L-arabinofuranosidase